MTSQQFVCKLPDSAQTTGGAKILCWSRQKLCDTIVWVSLVEFCETSGFAVFLLIFFRLSVLVRCLIEHVCLHPIVMWVIVSWFNHQRRLEKVPFSHTSAHCLLFYWLCGHCLCATQKSCSTVSCVLSHVLCSCVSAIGDNFCQQYLYSSHFVFSSALKCAFATDLWSRCAVPFRLKVSTLTARRTLSHFLFSPMDAPNWNSRLWRSSNASCVTSTVC